jgi:hypothetical protein
MADRMAAFAVIYQGGAAPHGQVAARLRRRGCWRCCSNWSSGAGPVPGQLRPTRRSTARWRFAPILMLWIYLGWVSVLLGASFASSMSAFRYQPVALRLPHGLRDVRPAAHARPLPAGAAQGSGLHSDEIQALEPMLTDSLVQQLLGQLASDRRGQPRRIRRMAAGARPGRRHPGRVVRSLPPAHAGRRGAPAAATMRWACAVMAVLDDLRMPLRDLLKRACPASTTNPRRRREQCRASLPSLMLLALAAAGRMQARRGNSRKPPTAPAATPRRARPRARTEKARRADTPVPDAAGRPRSMARPSTWPRSAASGWSSISGRPGAARA